MAGLKINLACGDSYVSGDGWINFDYRSSCRGVHQADLLKRLPLADNSADLVYCSHFFEHIPRDQVHPFLNECWRVLQPGGVLRLVVPNLEDLCRTYLYHRDRGEHKLADFVVIELLDQCVRRNPGGELWHYYQQLKAGAHPDSSMIAFVRHRTGEDLTDCSALGPRKFGLLSMLWLAAALFEKLWIRAVLKLLPHVFRKQNVSLASTGELHHWLYDAYQIQQLLEASGFVAVERCSPATSRYEDFPFIPLDLCVDGQPRKGAESLFIEATKPRTKAR